VKSPVVQSEDFYPFGLTFNSYTRENTVPQNYKFQHQEHIDDLSLDWDSFKWRNHQPEIGRFFNIDPLAAKYVYNSPYAFAENRVISGRELEGLEWAPPMNADNNPDVQALEEYQHARSEAGLGMVETVTDAAKGIYNLFTTDPRQSFNNLVDGIGTLITNPGAVKDAMVSSFNENPARFGGKVGGNILLAAATAGAANALKVGSVWELGAGARGMAIERTLGGNLPTNFPVIDKLSNGVATSIKSIDVTAKSYGKNGALLSTLKGYVNDLSNFSGATYGRTTITEGIDFTSKSLQVAIQPGKASLGQWEQISKAMKYAKDNGVQFNLQLVK
jgi:RHS repeat-associated protein